ncbi:uncharacterized protein CC84DRAFT_820150 [Paraphaeosphaeria sporulosa]|uniref:Uncharacterized protein n=1 Tax=Paraphaeosphaeria sporulosa TaxID=1460663 RepID=A0A177CBI2_9PLEO|nr:uncharacterized protein CC84DRAFT_820150 [Paraphaeosphaeria sporulosa]OAG05053.1 hypothetical protein CC84DRAFT_820150 [Paraphaeosphaeria sporulosa]
MLGHPGISAFEYAGAAEEHYREERAWEKATEETIITNATERHPTLSADLEREEASPQPVARPETSERQQPQTSVDEYTIAQRRRGTFVNHTPRNHELRLSSKLSHRPTSEEESGRLYASYRGSSDDNTETSKSCSGGQHSSFGSFQVEQSAKANANAPVELDSKEIPLNPLIMHPLPTVPIIPIALPRQRRSQSSSAAASIKSSQTGISKRSLRTFLGRNASLDASFPRQQISFDEPRPSTTGSVSKLRPQAANSKRRRRQTPYKVPAPLVTDLGRHAPLEPLVLHHRREVTGSDVDPLPPHVDIDNDISEAATLLAINEYFDSQEATLTDHQHPADLNEISASTLKALKQIQPSFSPQQTPKKGDAAPNKDPSDSKESTPSLPERNPERLSRINTPTSARLPKSASSISVQSDFTSAAQGQYSPYDERCDAVSKTVHRKPLPTSPREHGRSTSSISGKLAPRIPGHEELASSRLNDFNYFLRMTGPSPTHETKAVPQKKKKGLKVMKVRSRKEAKNPISSRRFGEEHLPVPACCLEETTKAGGVKHLRIKIPTEDVDVQLAAVPPRTPWTDEMVQPLAGVDVERAINLAGETSLMFKRCSPRPVPISPMAVPVEHHPLLVNRKEKTRSRKLRDLKKAKGRTDGDAECGAEEYIGEGKVERLEWLVGELAEGLRVEAGLEEGLGPEEVLETWREGRERAE